MRGVGVLQQVLTIDGACSYGLDNVVAHGVAPVKRVSHPGHIGDSDPGVKTVCTIAKDIVGLLRNVGGCCR